MGRFHHLKITLGPNLRVVEKFGGEVELVVVNYNSRDGMHEGLRDYVSFIEGGQLSYYHTTDVQYFSSPHSKNLSHLVAGGDYVVNLDGDTFLNAAGVARILQIFDAHPDAVMRGLTGLVGIKKNHFLSLGGYDEEFVGWGFDDDDLVSRARQAKFPYVEEDELVSRLEHGDEERVSNFDPALLERFEVEDATRMRWEMQKRNYTLSQDNLRRGIVEANADRVWGKARVTKNFSDELIEVGHSRA
jgi:predicted glycosyltransferase involved in capsule biosynthesis